jgi:hypothetical protein
VKKRARIVSAGFVWVLVVWMVGAISGYSQTRNYFHVVNATTNVISIMRGSAAYSLVAPLSQGTYGNMASNDLAAVLTLKIMHPVTFATLTDINGMTSETVNGWPGRSYEIYYCAINGQWGFVATGLENLDVGTGLAVWVRGLQIGGWIAAGVFGMFMIRSVVTGGSKRHEEEA